MSLFSVFSHKSVSKPRTLPIQYSLRKMFFFLFFLHLLINFKLNYKTQCYLSIEIHLLDRQKKPLCACSEERCPANIRYNHGRETVGFTKQSGCYSWRNKRWVCDVEKRGDKVPHVLCTKNVKSFIFVSNFLVVFSYYVNVYFGRFILF